LVPKKHWKKFLNKNTETIDFRIFFGISLLYMIINQPLTPKQKRILNFIKSFTEKNDYAPSLEEIAKHFKLKAVSTVHQYIQTLKRKGYLKKEDHQPRSFSPLKKTSEVIEVPLLGFISAGQPIEAIENPETIEVSRQLIPHTENIFALKVKGNSMIDEGIFDGDTVIIKKQETAEDGETIVAIINQNEATLKKIYREKNRIRLQPANQSLLPIFVDEVEIRGKVISVIRNFNQPKEKKVKKIKLKNEEFNKYTIEYIQNTDIKYRKSLGQYFTPQSIIKLLLSKLPNKKDKPKILDPGCGTGEFLLAAKQYFKNPILYGWDIDKNLINITKKVVPETKTKCQDSLLNEDYNFFDFVIGNPPYFEFSPSSLINKKFTEIINGRINIFSLFVYQGIKWLKEGGYLAYVVPPSMNNGAYFAKLRQFIVKNSNIEYLKVFDNAEIFDGALQSVMIIVLKKGKNKNNYLFKKNGILIFTENSSFLKDKFKNKFTLHDLNYEVKTGKLVWNKNKNLLTNDEKNGIPLIWSHNIAEGELKFPILRKDKPQYVRIDNYDVGPAIVVNRITGSVKSSKLRAAIIPAKMKFVAENHVNVIFPKNNSELFNFKKIYLKDIVKQLISPENMELVKYITGNTQLSKNELENLFPLTIN